MLTISTAPPSSPPPSGTLLLFNRSVTKNYKDDRHEWMKKRNSNKIREDHVKLRVNGQFRVSGCYVHSTNIPNFHRRTYHLLNPETGKALYPVTSALNSTRNAPPSLILVHYLDTKVSAANSASLVQKDVDVNPNLSPSNGDPQNTMLAAASLLSASTHHHDHLLVPTWPPQNYQPQSQPQQQPLLALSQNFNNGDQPMHWYNNTVLAAAFDATTRSLREMNVVVKQSNDGGRVRTNSELSAPPEMIERTHDYEAVGNRFENGQLLALNMQQSETELKALADTLLTRWNASDTEAVDIAHQMSQTEHINSALNTFGEEAFMPDVVDITPDFVALGRGDVKLILSCSFSVPSIFDGAFAWSQLACFIEASVDGSVDPRNLEVTSIQDVTMLNPYSYQCQLNQSFLMPGTYRLVIIAIRWLHVDDGDEPLNSITNVVSRLLRQAFLANSFNMHLPPQCHTVSVDGVDGKILTQLSKSSFHCFGHLPKRVKYSDAF